MSSIKNAVPFPLHDHELAYRWPQSKAQDWFDKNGWVAGCNFVPSNAINQLEMWQEETFSPDLIDKELAMAAGLGFNTIRVFLHHLLGEGVLWKFISGRYHKPREEERIFMFVDMKSSTAIAEPARTTPR